MFIFRLIVNCYYEIRSEISNGNVETEYFGFRGNSEMVAGINNYSINSTHTINTEKLKSLL